MTKTKKDMKQLYCYDGTMPYELIKQSELHSLLRSVCKGGVFQGEIGELTGYKHWQMRFSLKNKKRQHELIKMMNNLHKCFWSCNWSPTSNANKNNYNYVTKERTKFIEAISLNENIYIPRQVREIKNLRPFQDTIIDQLNVFDTRHINYIYQPKGNVGKSILVSYLRAYKLARCLPSILKDGKDIMRMVMNMPTSKAYFFDMPKAMKKENLFSFYSAIEEIKNGYAWDDRYSFKEKCFDCPQVWIMSNSPPFLDWLSIDRWKFYTINNESFELEKLEINYMKQKSKSYFDSDNFN